LNDVEDLKEGRSNTLALQVHVCYTVLAITIYTQDDYHLVIEAYGLIDLKDYQTTTTTTTLIQLERSLVDSRVLQ
jgi:hypothetical protein